MRWRVLLAALLLDALLGELPNRAHPVAWMGTVIAWCRAHAPKNGRALPLFAGAVIAAGGAVAVYLLVRVLARLPLGVPLAALLLKQTFSLRGLNTAAWEVEVALREGDLAEARCLLSWHLVSRDVTQLNEAQVAAAAIESVAENTSDGIIAPLLFYAMGGLPAAYAYRWAQTCDSMLGYRDAEREWLGKVPARLDDVLNLLPARVTALLFVLVSGKPGQAWRIWWRDGSATASPNAGQAMSAAAGALGVELEKVGHYTLGAGLPAPNADNIPHARRLMCAAVGVFAVMLLVLHWLVGWVRRG